MIKFFEGILEYISHTSGQEEWHLIQEPKTEVDAQEADGSLGIFTREKKKTLAVIELKDAKTPLDKKQSGRVGKMTPVEQAFNYLNKFDGCKWAIVSNFREIRIYSKMRGQGFYEKFDIIDLHQEQEFKRFYYIFNKANLIDEGEESAIETLVKNTTTQEENITKKFYEHYKEIRIKLLNHLFEHNPEVNNLVLVEKTQKLLDRLIFTMVCEDSSTLLPAQIVKNTYDRAFQSFALSDSDQRAWSEFKGLFHAIDKGNRRVMPPINAYNGGLFKYDEILDNLIIKDDVFDEIIKLTDYDFESELNVNVLGHIFEQSISDLEEIREAVNLLTENGGELLTEDGKKIALEQSKRKVVPKSGKRKKMGIFYTPEYITKYIVENTVGKYLEENPKKLESIKILDPACGSGAFLNQAHSFLLNEYKIRTEEKQLEKTKKGEMLTLWDTNTTENDKTILLDNLFGVDLSPESVDITKLALWLKTA
ncbi:N-6 DNA methylase, partial [Patescibacteria group bacterium]|nr:N-6 DNA methylase [Patescibacteria group bacterium]